MNVTTINPATEQPLATSDAARAWRGTPPERRAAALRRLADVLRDRARDLALLATREMGKPLAESRAEIGKCAWACEWYAEHAPTMLPPEAAHTGALRSRMIYTPMGVLLAIMPRNFPYWQVIRALAPALSAGSVVVLKHAPRPPDARSRSPARPARPGCPREPLSVLVVSAERTGEVMPGVIGDDRIAAVTLTGSTRAGRTVAAAGRALKKTVLELGGSDAFAVLADADLDAAAAWAARSRFQNTGQSCIAAKRVIVEEPAADAGSVAYPGTMTLPGLRQLAHKHRRYHRSLRCCPPAGSVAPRVPSWVPGGPPTPLPARAPAAITQKYGPEPDAFTGRLLDRVRELRLGDPAEEEVTIGPLARADPRDAIAGRSATRWTRARRSSPAAGHPAELASIMSRPCSTMSGRVWPCWKRRSSAPRFRCYGPATRSTPLLLANDSRYGAGQRRLDLQPGPGRGVRGPAGRRAYGGQRHGRLDPRLPFGGVKDSGYGRELSRHGLLEFVNIHAIVTSPPGGPGESRGRVSE